MDLPCQSFVREIFLRLLSVLTLSAVCLEFLQRPMWEGCGRPEGNPWNTAPSFRLPLSPSAPHPPSQCLPRSRCCRDFLVAECGLERGVLLYLDLSLSALSWPEAVSRSCFWSPLSLLYRLKCNYFMACVSGVQFCSQLLLQTLMVVPYVSWFWTVSFHLLRGSCTHASAENLCLTRSGCGPLQAGSQHSISSAVPVWRCIVKIFSENSPSPQSTRRTNSLLPSTSSEDFLTHLVIKDVPSSFCLFVCLMWWTLFPPTIENGPGLLCYPTSGL